MMHPGKARHRILEARFLQAEGENEVADLLIVAARRTVESVEVRGVALDKDRASSPHVRITSFWEGGHPEGKDSFPGSGVRCGIFR